MYSAFNDPSHKCGNPVYGIPGSGHLREATISVTNTTSWEVKPCRLTDLPKEVNKTAWLVGLVAAISGSRALTLGIEGAVPGAPRLLLLCHNTHCCDSRMTDKSPLETDFTP